LGVTTSLVRSLEVPFRCLGMILRHTTTLIK
jgi:hypothetical protein